MQLKLSVLVSCLLVSTTSMAENYLTEAEIKELFTNKTFDILTVANGSMLQGYDNKKGHHFVYLPDKDKVSKRTWWTDGDQHCTSHPKRGDSCKMILAMGNGVYHGITDGEHTHTLSNFRVGRDLPQ